jgi:isopenicillin N synthase-like dioxygenase
MSAPNTFTYPSSPTADSHCDRTKQAVDYREQIDIATELPAPSADEPRYRKLRGPNQWPNEELIPGFRKTIEEYIARMTDLSTEFTSLVRLLCRVGVVCWLTVAQIAEAIGLPANAFERFFEGIGESQSGTQRQDKLKLVKYPDMAELGAEGESAQGGMYSPVVLSIANVLSIVGPHKGMELSFGGAPAGKQFFFWAT